MIHVAWNMEKQHYDMNKVHFSKVHKLVRICSLRACETMPHVDCIANKLCLLPKSFPLLVKIPKPIMYLGFVFVKHGMSSLSAYTSSNERSVSLKRWLEFVRGKFSKSVRSFETVLTCKTFFSGMRAVHAQMCAFRLSWATIFTGNPFTMQNSSDTRSDLMRCGSCLISLAIHIIYVIVELQQVIHSIMMFSWNRFINETCNKLYRFYYPNFIGKFFRWWML